MALQDFQSEGSNRARGREAQKHNIAAAKALADTIRTTLGPKGMDKMVIGSSGEVTITNDGATILGAMEIQHPTARMLAEAAATQDSEAGDGTTTVVVLAGELLKKAEELLDSGLHPTLIIQGYRMAFQNAVNVLESIAKPLPKEPGRALRDIALTAMTGKGVEGAREHLAGLAVRAAKILKDTKGLRGENLKIVAVPGGKVEDSELIEGIILEKQRVKEGMPREVANARIALFDSPLEVRATEIDSKITISSPEQIEQFLQKEDSILKGIVQAIVNSGANVVFCQKGIDDLVQHQLEKAGIYTVRRVSAEDMRLLAKATGARIVSGISELSPAELGKAGRVYELRLGEVGLCIVGECPNSKAISILLRGGTQHVVDEVKRAMNDAFGGMAALLETARLLGGAGAAEIEISRALTRYANTLSGREQLAVLAFARAMEIIPATLAENSGLDSIAALASLRAAHDRGEAFAGLDVETGKVINTLEAGIIEPLKVKLQALSSAVEVATMILRIDDIIVNEPKPEPRNSGLE